MDFAFSADQLAIQSAVREFVRKECPPLLVNQWELDGKYPDAVFRRMAELGWVGLPFPEEYGGMGGTAVDMCILAEELSRSGYDLSAGFGIRMFCGLNLLHFGTEEQKRDYLPGLLAGELKFSTSITEAGSGSDAAGLITRAEMVDGGWLINGQKLYSTAAHVHNTVIQLFCRTDPDAAKHKGISVFLVPNDTAGVEITRLKSLGRNLVGTNIIYLTDVFVPDSALLGQFNAGWQVMMSSLLGERLYISAGYLGAMQSVVDEALAHAKQRTQFGKPIGSFQVIAHLLADMQTRTDAARLMVYRAAAALVADEDARRLVSEAKLFASENFYAVAGDAMQIMGGAGYMVESTIQRHFRDARSATITGGTSQIQRTIIARTLGLETE